MVLMDMVFLCALQVTGDQSKVYSATGQLGDAAVHRDFEKGTENTGHHIDVLTL